VHEIEAGRYCRNYRARSYHNPDLVRRIQSQGQPSGLDELIQSLAPWAAADCRHGTCENRRAALVTALELFVLCKTTCPDQLEGLGIRSSFQMGAALGKLTDYRPDDYRPGTIVRGSKRYILVEPVDEDASEFPSFRDVPIVSVVPQPTAG
jgi:hypothetical protein